MFELSGKGIIIRVCHCVANNQQFLSSLGASLFAATPCMPRTLALNTEPHGSVYDDPT